MPVCAEEQTTPGSVDRNPTHKLALACALDDEGRLDWASPAWETITGISAAMLAGRKLTDLVHPDDSENVAHHLTGCCPGGQIRQFRARLTQVDGDHIPLLWTVSSTGDNRIAHAIEIGAADREPPAVPDPVEQWEVMRHCMTNALVAIGPNGAIRFVNERALSLLEFERGDLVGRNAELLWPSDQTASWRVDLNRLRLTGATRDTVMARETSVLTKTGRSIPVQLTVTRHERDGVVTFALLMRDITTELFARRSLTASKQRFEFCFTRALNAVCLGDVRGHVLEANDRFVEMCGYDRSELTIRGWMCLVHPDDLAVLQRDIVAFDRGAGASLTRVVRMCGRDGAPGWIDVALGSVTTTAGAMPTPVVMLSDVTQRENTLQVLEDTQSRLHTAFERSLVGQAILDPEGRFVAANSALARMLGCAEDELPGMAAESFVHPDDLAGVREAAHRLRTHQVTGWRGEVRLVGRRGGALWALILASAAFDEHGRPSQLLAQVEDISAQKQLFTAITRSNTDLQRFTHLASHDLQAPLRTIAGYTDLLIDSLDTSQLTEDQLDLADRIKGGVVDMQALIGDLLTVCRVDIDQTPSRPTSASDAFRLALARLDADIERAGASVRCLAGCDVTVSVRSGQLVIVLQNLIQNAITHLTPDHRPEVTVSGRNVGPMVELRVADNGPGIEPSMRDHVFEMFVKGSSAGGTGMGLALVKRVIENQGGEIWIEDNNPGTVFVIRLPAGAVADRAEQAG